MLFLSKIKYKTVFVTVSIFVNASGNKNRIGNDDCNFKVTVKFRHAYFLKTTENYKTRLKHIKIIKYCIATEFFLLKKSKSTKSSKIATF